MITFQGLGSGLQVGEIVEAIVGAEKVPYESRMNQQQAIISADISAVGALKSALEKVQESIANLADVDKYQQRTTAGDDDFISLSSSKEASVGSYSVKVDALASSHKLLSTGIDSEEAIGEGTLTFNSGTNSFDVTVSDTATLSEIRDSINDNEDNDSVIATIITDDNGQHLVLTSKDTGVANTITVTANDVGDGDHTDNIGLSRLASNNLTEVDVAADAQITIDGTLVVTSSTNEFSNVIDGIDITAKKAQDVDDDLSQVKISEDNSNIKETLDEFVKAYNELVDLSSNLGKVGDGNSGILSGDSLLRGVMSKIRNEISSSFDFGNNGESSLTQLGIETDKYGKLSIDDSKLNDAIKENVDNVQSFFIGTDAKPGLAGTINEMLNFYTESDGLIQGRIDSKEKQLSGIDVDRANFSRKMDSLEARLSAQYNSMDLLVASLNSTSSYLMQQLDNMPGVVRKS
ncbi:flagellar filament capping protein FliD [Colwellia psychrerythraea]|uniref:Flagellar hook-associated protein 2 n=1 Tax=Colwellia psychrerythraea TaxID=28229 RepID=A0A099L3I1_COLPS|nr:flagellar hook-associated 2 domain-containing protein [Colwellia psychrerythraea]